MSQHDDFSEDGPLSQENIYNNQSPEDPGSAGDGRTKRTMSSINFPYNSLESCIEVAQKVYEHVGRSAAEPGDVAAWLGSTVTSGTFKIRMSATRMFGLIGGERGTVRVTELACRILDPATSAKAKVEAFLTVPLYRRIYDENRGRLLPRAAGLEAEMVAIGVAPNQKERARQVFEKAAKEAGFFAFGTDRLVEPSFPASGVETKIPDVVDPVADPQERTTIVRNSEVSGVANDPLVQGLLSRMPPPEKGWPAADRARWLQTFAMNLSVIYGDQGEVDVKATARGSTGSAE
jgi:hypothetical protein